jgi:hypothetical protein
MGCSVGTVYDYRLDDPTAVRVHDVHTELVTRAIIQVPVVESGERTDRHTLLA